jgi:hypothetical protein
MSKVVGEKGKWLEIDIEKQLEMFARVPKMRLHTHPAMERECKVPDGHVIIDKNVFDELFRIMTFNHKRYVNNDASFDRAEIGQSERIHGG